MARGLNLVASPTVFVDGAPMGSASCVWVAGSLTTYVLTAAHVVDAAPAHTPIQWMTPDGDTGDGRTVEAHLNWIPVDGGLLDAGLISVDEPGPFGIFGDYPWASSILGFDKVIPGTSAVICGRSQPVFCTFDGLERPGRLFSLQRHGRLLRFTFDSAETVGGDSGAPVISLPEGMLIGMHVGERVEPDGRRFAWAVAATDIQNEFEKVMPGFSLRP